VSVAGATGNAPGPSSTTENVPMRSGETTMSDSDTVTIEVDRLTYERFEQQRQSTKNEHVPAMDPSVFLDALLDTDEAIRNGYYAELEYSENNE